MVEFNGAPAGNNDHLRALRLSPVTSTYPAGCMHEAMDLLAWRGGRTSFRRESRLLSPGASCAPAAPKATVAPAWYPIGGRVYLRMDPGPHLR